MSTQLAAVNLTANDATPQFTPGTRYTTNDGKEYRYYKFNNGAGNVAAVAGNFAYFYAVSGASAGQVTEVTMDQTDSGGIGAGVFQAVLTDGYYGWFQTRGHATLTTALTAGADGNALTAIGGTDGTIDVPTAVTDPICAFAVDADAKIVMLVCP